ncbi:hypothetical protein [Paraburkholderia adhaesiva]|uniref:hypothetical protein n=1 Tax=Paraburkholderia adhaesiva TaxID=2883244 RepID=UPI001F193C2D|nr:hypothetical protein [Paraburkholderia adhaesiva]
MPRKKKRLRRSAEALPAETLEELQERLQQYAARTRPLQDRPTVPFPEQVTVLAGPRRRVPR